MENIRLHFRKHYKTESREYLYIAFCQAIAESETPPPIRDLSYESMIRIAFEENKSFVYAHNKTNNPLPMNNDKYENFITMAPPINKNIFSFKKERNDVVMPFLAASLSIKCKEFNLLIICY